MTLRGRPTQIFAAPPKAEAPVPRWLLELATLTVRSTVDGDGNAIDAPPEPARWEKLRREIEALPAESPYSEWGKWLVAPPEMRPIVPGVAAHRVDPE